MKSDIDALIFYKITLDFYLEFYYYFYLERNKGGLNKKKSFR